MNCKIISARWAQGLARAPAYPAYIPMANIVNDGLGSVIASYLSRNLSDRGNKKSMNVHNAVVSKTTPWFIYSGRLCITKPI